MALRRGETKESTVNEDLEIKVESSCQVKQYFFKPLHVLRSEPMRKEDKMGDINQEK